MDRVLDKISVNVVEIIPFKNHKEKFKIVKKELEKNRFVEVWDEYIYSQRKWWWGHGKRPY